jgi:hypothetical protein
MPNVPLSEMLDTSSSSEDKQYSVVKTSNWATMYHHVPHSVIVVSVQIANAG